MKLQSLEIWKWIPGYEGIYEASNFGFIRSVDHYAPLRPGFMKLMKGRLLKFSKAGRGYNSVWLSKNGSVKAYNVHRLIALLFLPNPDNLPEVNHKDEDKTNNFIWINSDGTVDPIKSNLEWCTSLYNANYGNRNRNQVETKKIKRKFKTIPLKIQYPTA